MAYSAPPLGDRIIIRPGEHRAMHGTAVMQTLLGSCVAACLFDEKLKIAGMNHFLLANHRYSKSMPINVTEAGRYGINAMELLINDMLKLGAVKRRLKAKVFGAGNIITGIASDTFLCIGDVNGRFIREFLATEEIELLSEDLGGEFGRIIHFHTDTFQVFRRLIPKSQTVKVEMDERTFWKTEVTKHGTEAEGDVVLFDSKKS